MSQELAASLIADLGQEKEYAVHVEERPDIRCDKCGAHVGDDGQVDPSWYREEWD